MTVPGTRWLLPVAFTVLATVADDGARLRAADDVIPPTLTCVDGVLARITPRPGVRVRFRRRWFCDVDRQVNGVCTFGRRCRQGLCPAICLHCGVTVPVPVGEERREGRLTLACTASSTRTPCGPTLNCDTATEVCV